MAEQDTFNCCRSSWVQNTRSNVSHHPLLQHSVCLKRHQVPPLPSSLQAFSFQVCSALGLLFPRTPPKPFSLLCTTPGPGSRDGTYHLKRILYRGDSPQHSGSVPARAGSQHPHALPTPRQGVPLTWLRLERFAGLQRGLITLQQLS